MRAAGRSRWSPWASPSRAVGAVLAQLLVVLVGVLAPGVGTAWLISARADPARREQETLIRALWSMGRRWPDGEGPIDPVTGQVLAIERHGGFLTLVVATPAEDALPSGGSDATVTRYLLGLITLPAPPSRCDGEQVLAAADRSGGREALGLREVRPGRLHADPAIFLERLLRYAVPAMVGLARVGNSVWMFVTSCCNHQKARARRPGLLRIRSRRHKRFIFLISLSCLVRAGMEKYQKG